MTLDWEPMLRAISADARNGVPIAVISRRFHEGLSDGILMVAREVGAKQVAITGGCFMNRLLTELTMAKLSAGGFTPIRHRLVPPGDGGLALGQAVMGQWTL
jgi:hydrogenase maturation protein HypF